MMDARQRWTIHAERAPDLIGGVPMIPPYPGVHQLPGADLIEPLRDGSTETPRRPALTRASG
jgi:hypothetical protein